MLEEYPVKHQIFGTKQCIEEDNLEPCSCRETTLDCKGIELYLNANRTLLRILSDIADHRGIKLGFRRATDRGKEYTDLCDQELHLETLAWLDENNFWHSLPENIALPDGSGEIDKLSLKKVTDGQASMMMRMVLSCL